MNSKHNHQNKSFNGRTSCHQTNHVQTTGRYSVNPGGEEMNALRR